MLSDIQKEAIKLPCPNCHEGKLRPVEDYFEQKLSMLLYCDTCLVAMDSDGGYTH